MPCIEIPAFTRGKKQLDGITVEQTTEEILPMFESTLSVLLEILERNTHYLVVLNQ